MKLILFKDLLFSLLSKSQWKNIIVTSVARFEIHIRIVVTSVILWMLFMLKLVALFGLARKFKIITVRVLEFDAWTI